MIKVSIYLSVEALEVLLNLMYILMRDQLFSQIVNLSVMKKIQNEYTSFSFFNLVLLPLCQLLKDEWLYIRLYIPIRSHFI